MRQFKNCLKSGKIRKFKSSKEKIKVELKAARNDLKEAKDRFTKKKYKYATITAYYSLFHSARVLLYLKEYREKSHYCLKIAIEALYVKEKDIYRSFHETARRTALYHIYGDGKAPVDKKVLSKLSRILRSLKKEEIKQ